MTDLDDKEALRLIVAAIVTSKYGRAEEELMASGIIDSIAAIDLALTLEREFALQPDNFQLADMRSISAIVNRVCNVRSADRRNDSNSRGE
jgi:acyl carrier protein